ncbi:hypothetical protein M0657_012252 [Pyricularia oryzae]|nr:hypothetical protein M0657_012252 [Pyricularia oryzae]
MVQKLKTENDNNNPKDSLGWIFQQIFISRSQKDQTLEKQWKSLFSKHKKRYLTYVISEKLKSRFQALLKIPGLWHQSPFGNMHKVEAMKCVEVGAANQAVVDVQLTSTGQESSHYLSQILSIFTSFVRGQTQLLGSIDSYTVAALEGKCPGLSKHDRLRLESLLESGKLLPRASSENRQLFIDAVCEFKRQIPSLGTFFNDMRYLEGLNAIQPCDSPFDLFSEVTKIRTVSFREQIQISTNGRHRRWRNSLTSHKDNSGSVR